MTIPQMPISYNPSPTPTIYERETTAQHDLQNKGDMADRKFQGAVIIPQSEADSVPFTKYAERSTWNYKSEADRPSLPPVFTARGAPASPEEKTGSAEANYSELHDQLPDGLKATMKDYPSPLTVAFDNVLKLLGAGAAWLESVTTMLSSENATARMEVNKRYPDGSFANTVASGKDYVESALQLLDDIGPNHPDYLEVKGFIDTVKNDLDKVKEEK